MTLPNKTTKKKITVIPASKTIQSKPLYEMEYRKLRVCAYARVSTDLEEQQSSYAAQIRYYKNYINKNEKWEFVGVYADEGISGTSTKNRDGFNRMIEDAKKGKIDLIITKSISRFARNTLDTIRITRELKDIGVEVYFEKENLKSMDSTTEVQLTILSSLAQDESRSLSDNVKWGQERKMREGKFHLPWSCFLGYDKGPDGLPVINEEEAKIVRTIYDLYIAGKTSGYIARYLEEQNILSPGGKKKWSTGTILSILKNEKYKGDAKIHKTFTVDYLSKKVKKNDGEVPQYYVTNSHPAIIDPQIFDLVQNMLNNRARKSGHRNNKYTFGEKLVCQKCGEFYTRKQAWINGKKHISWNCYSKYDYKRPAKDRCQSTPVYEPEIKNGYIVALGQINARKGEILPKFATRIAELEDTERKAKLKQKVIKLENKLSDIQKSLNDATMLSSSSFADINNYDKQINDLEKQAAETARKLEETKQIIQNNNAELVLLKNIKTTLTELEMVTYTDKLFISTIDHIKISDTSLEYVFYGNEKIKITRNEKRGSYDEVIS